MYPGKQNSQEHLLSGPDTYWRLILVRVLGYSDNIFFSTLPSGPNVFVIKISNREQYQSIINLTVVLFKALGWSNKLTSPINL